MPLGQYAIRQYRTFRSTRVGDRPVAEFTERLVQRPASQVPFRPSDPPRSVLNPEPRYNLPVIPRDHARYLLPPRGPSA
eukprot:2020976-Rhodomonas_salina.1